MKDINSSIIEILKYEQKVTLGFSAGKDSLSCAVILRNMGIEYIPFYFYHCPDLQFVEETLTMYEKLLNISIIRLPHPMLYDCLRHQDFQPWLRAVELEEKGFIKVTFEDMIDAYLQGQGDMRHYYDVNGMRASESFNRRMLMKNHGPIDHEKKKIALIHDWTNKEVRQFLMSAQIPLSKDYDIWDRSFDGLKYQFLFGVKKHYPEDWQILLEYFPLLELEIFRYETNSKY